MTRSLLRVLQPRRYLPTTSRCVRIRGPLHLRRVTFYEDRPFEPPLMNFIFNGTITFSLRRYDGYARGSGRSSFSLPPTHPSCVYEGSTCHVQSGGVCECFVLHPSHPDSSTSACCWRSAEVREECASFRMFSSPSRPPRISKSAVACVRLAVCAPRHARVVRWRGPSLSWGGVRACCTAPACTARCDARLLGSCRATLS